jgi:RecA/RadA recombinase
MGLLDKINKKIEDDELGSEIERYSIKTGVDFLDYANGQITEEGKVDLGVKGGRIITLVGDSGSGKTTLGLKIGGNIIDTHEDASMIIKDGERANSHTRIMNVIGKTKEDYNENYKNRKIKIINDRVSTESIFALIDSIHRVKLEEYCGVKFLKKGRDNKAVKGSLQEMLVDMPPTVILVDSWAVIAPDSFEQDDETRGNMDGAAIAKANNGLIKSILGKIFEANIILIIINHITTAINIGFIPKDTRKLKFLKENESLPGGVTAIYESDYTLRVEQKKRLKPDEGFYISGFEQDVTVCKSRSNIAGFNFTLVYNQYTGVSNVLSNFLLLKNNGKVSGGGKGFFLSALPEVKFQQKDIEDLYNDNKKFRKAFKAQVKELFSSFLYEGKELVNEPDEEDNEITPFKIKKMTVKEIQKLAKDEGVEINLKDYKGTDGLSRLRDDMIETLFESDEEESDE